MEDHFIGYLLDALDDRTKSEVDEYLTMHPDAHEKLDLLRHALAPLSADKDTPPPPPQLAERTLAKVAEHLCNRDRTAHDLPQAPLVSPATLSTGRSWWRRADVLVAACLLVTVAGVSLVVLNRMRAPSSAAMLVECKNNLLQFYVALQTYRDHRGKLPDITEQAPRDRAGMVVPILQDAGTLPSSASIRCPGVGSPVSCQLSLSSLKTMSPDDFEQNSPCLSMCYAYSLGYRDEAGVYHGPGATTKGSWSQTPIMADRPPPEGIAGHSINHGGEGQNVLFADGHVQYLFQTRKLGSGDDIFLNRNGKLAAGLDAGDFVLGPSAARP